MTVDAFEIKVIQEIYYRTTVKLLHHLNSKFRGLQSVSDAIRKKDC